MTLTCIDTIWMLPGGHMNKLLFLLTLLLFSFLEAKMVDGIAIIVEGESITTAEIRTLRSQMHISKAKAIDLLIQDRLQNVAMKDIKVPEEEIDAQIAKIAKENTLSIPKMQKILKRQGTSWVKYRDTIRASLKKSRFYQDVVVASTPDPTEDELKLYYNKYKRDFKIPSTIHMIEYSAKTEKALQVFLTSRKSVGITSKRLTKSTKKLALEMLSMLLQTPNNKYTKILNAGDKFITYKVVSKRGSVTMPYEVAQGAITSKWKEELQGKALKDYFKKLRTRADIQILR